MSKHASRIAAGLATALFGLLATAGAHAATVTYQTGPGLGLDIADTLPETSATIDVPDSGTILRVGLLALVEHTYLGDLIWTLTGPDGTLITLADRPGRVDSGFGDSSDLTLDRALIFGDQSPLAAEDMGTGGCDGTDSLVGIDCIRWFAPDDPLSTFAGSDTLGAWTLTISDNAGGDDGLLDGWLIAFEVEMAAVPGPSALLLMASALIGAGALRRKSTA